MEEGKTEGPCSTIKFLGIEFDSQALEIRLPEDKLEKLRSLLGHWKGRETGKKGDLVSLIGSLQHASKAILGRAGLPCIVSLIYPW